jgi:hypothetical protein
MKKIGKKLEKIIKVPDVFLHVLRMLHMHVCVQRARSVFNRIKVFQRVNTKHTCLRAQYI